MKSQPELLSVSRTEPLIFLPYYSGTGSQVFVRRSNRRTNISSASALKCSLFTIFTDPGEILAQLWLRHPVTNDFAVLVLLPFVGTHLHPPDFDFCATSGPLGDLLSTHGVFAVLLANYQYDTLMVCSRNHT